MDGEKLAFHVMAVFITALSTWCCMNPMFWEAKC